MEGTIINIKTGVFLPQGPGTVLFMNGNSQLHAVHSAQYDIREYCTMYDILQTANCRASKKNITQFIYRMQFHAFVILCHVADASEERLFFRI